MNTLNIAGMTLNYDEEALVTYVMESQEYADWADSRDDDDIGFADFIEEYGMASAIKALKNGTKL